MRVRVKADAYPWLRILHSPTPAENLGGMTLYNWCEREA